MCGHISDGNAEDQSKTHQSAVVLAVCEAAAHEIVALDERPTVDGREVVHEAVEHRGVATSTGK